MKPFPNGCLFLQKGRKRRVAVARLGGRCWADKGHISRSGEIIKIRKSEFNSAIIMHSVILKPSKNRMPNIPSGKPRLEARQQSVLGKVLLKIPIETHKRCISNRWAKLKLRGLFQIA